MRLRITFCLLAAGDLGITLAMLGGGWREINPLAPHLPLAALKGGSVVVALTIVEAIRRLAPGAERWCLYGICGLEALAVAWNVAHLILH